ncbi:hypothetical protein PRUB_b0595 [Pseudoalteromonas rubra]|uniref:Uncharacterized protein n=1 Tax=Pseudoalteromonas rubra TaxID=43658 RepID=A0A8T0C182_9GAMM|nr:hypothetical protein [Pseudoalteromonas rubra]KAF7781394.1 hypothetical protein PRUB_b0595 [Pseudoalteromonas rubra]
MNAQSHWMVLYEALTQNEAGYFYNDQLFSGIAIQHNNGVVVGRLVFEKGKQVDDYTPPYLNQTEQAILDTIVEDVLEPVHVNGQLYSGIIYTVSSNGWISGENVFFEGLGDEGTTYHYNTNIRHELSLKSKLGDKLSIDEYYEWDAEGRVVAWTVVFENAENEAESGSISFAVNEDQSLHYFSVGGNFTLVADNSDRLVCPYHSVIDNLRQYNSFSLESFCFGCSEQALKREQEIKKLIVEFKPKSLELYDFSGRCMEFIHFAIANGVKQLEVIDYASEQEKAALHTLMAHQYPHIKMI